MTLPILNSTVPSGGRYLTSRETKALRSVAKEATPNDLYALGSGHYAHLYHRGSSFGLKVTTK